MTTIQTDIRRLIGYGVRTGLVPEEDVVYTANRLLELFGLEELECPKAESETEGAEGGDKAAEPSVEGELEEILNRMCDYAYEKGTALCIGICSTPKS